MSSKGLKAFAKGVGVAIIAAIAAEYIRDFLRDDKKAAK